MKHTKTPKIKGVYKMICLANDKYYIGSTADDFIYRVERCLQKLDKGTRHNKDIQNDYNIYGKDNFKFEMIIETNDNKEAKYLEAIIIQQCFDDKNCYNKKLEKKNLLLFTK